MTGNKISTCCFGLYCMSAVFAGCSGSGADVLCPGDSCVDVDGEIADGGMDGGDLSTGEDGDELLDGGENNEQSNRIFQTSTILGQGGFFGICGTPLMNVQAGGVFAIGAHYADISDAGQEALLAGRVYLFRGGSFPASIDDAALILQAPDGAQGGGFGYTLGNSCDLNSDGFLDFPVGNHLYSPPDSQDYNSGRAVVFWGDSEGLDPATATYHHLSQDLRERSDVIGQTVLCVDADGDGIDDLLLGGQNAGPDNTGVLAVFRGGPDGPGETQDFVLLPQLPESKQYFGASSLLWDLDGDGLDDLAVGGWGLVSKQVSGNTHTGGILVYSGGTDWELGSSYGLYPSADTEVQSASVMAIVGQGPHFLAVGSPKLGALGPDDPQVPGGVLLYRLGSAEIHQGLSSQVLLVPAGYEGSGFGQTIAWIPDYFGSGRGAMLVGMKYADAASDNIGTGAVAVYALDSSGERFVQDPQILLAPNPLSNDAFGGSIVCLGDVDGDGLGDFFVGIESHIESGSQEEIQTGGAIFYH